MAFFTPKHHEIAAKYPYEIQLAGNLMVFQPRDGTRYELLFTKLGEEARLMGCSPDAVMVTVMRGSNQYVSMAAGGYSHPGYIQEKLGVPERTAEVVARAIQFALRGVDIGPFEGRE